MERVDLTHAYGTDRQRRWRTGAVGAWDTSTVTFGRLSDGRWFAERTGPAAAGDGDAYVYGADERGHELALALAYGWMRGGDYRPVPAAFDGDGKPIDGLPWRRSGAEWFLDAQSSGDVADDG